MAEIVKVYYKASNGTEYPLQMTRALPAPGCGVELERTIRIKSANFHNWNYEPETQVQALGVKALRFYKQPASYQAQLYIDGPIEDRKKIIERMHAAFERDIRALTPGRLYWRESYITCFILASSTYPEPGSRITVNDIEIWCPYPLWIRERTKTFRKADDPAATAPFLDYTYDFMYDYTPDVSATGTIQNDGTAAAPMKIIFHGPADYPKIIIGGNTYQVNVTLAEGETAEYDTLEKTITVTNVDGISRNAFNMRGKTGKEFDPIPIGTIGVEWPGRYDVTVTVLQERSEPSWN